MRAGPPSPGPPLALGLVAAMVYAGVLFSFYFYVEAGLEHRYDGLLTWESLFAYVVGAVPYLTVLLLGMYMAFVSARHSQRQPHRRGFALPMRVALWILLFAVLAFPVVAGLLLTELVSPTKWSPPQAEIIRARRIAKRLTADDAAT